MAHTPTNWQDYPSTSTPITAAQLTRIDSLNAAAYDLIDYALDRIIAPYSTVTETLTADSWLIISSSPHWTVFPSGFDPDEQALIIRRNGELIPLSMYHFVEIQSQIVFDSSMSFAIDDVMTYVMYKPQAGAPRTQGVTQQLLTGTQTGYSAGIAYPVNDEIIDGEVWQ